MAAHISGSSLKTAPHTSTSLWRHQESSHYRRQAYFASRDTTEAHESRGETDANPACKFLTVRCGPLLNYRRVENEIWYGSVLIVTNCPDSDACSIILNLELFNENTYSHAKNYQNAQQIRLETEISNQFLAQERTFTSLKLYSDQENTFWRFNLQVPMQEFEIRCIYSFPGLNLPQGQGGTDNENLCFLVPAVTQSMRIMFYSCNGFSVGTDERIFNGPCLWKDVLRVHKKTPFHVMIGGGDQIYNDGIRVDGPLKKWANMPDPLDREQYPFSSSLKRKCDKYYVDNYILWYSSEPFTSCNRKIPQLNIWDDHDIIDGFGSYSDQFMNCAVFKGIGGVAYKYYLLFQHHLAPPATSFTSDSSESLSASSTFVLHESNIDPSYILGPIRGPYLTEFSHNIYTKLGARISFLGIDGRTERTQFRINYKDTYNLIFNRINEELKAARSSSSPIQHLIILLGIPIAYPRLNWLENIFRSPAIAPIRFLNKKFGIGESFFNHFDGNVDLLDDLDDHYTSRNHKDERRILVEQLQEIAKEYSVRISFLGGDVHLAAVGRFYSNPRHGIPISQDHRYMTNIISSAIVNKPPPSIVAYTIAKRNKIHHLNEDTNETLIKFFDHDPITHRRSLNPNYFTMPRRNWTMITENSLLINDSSGRENLIDRGKNGTTNQSRRPLKTKDERLHIHNGEVHAGICHKSTVPGLHGKDTDGSLDFCICVEIDKSNEEGLTKSYGMTIPRLELNKINQ
ncbi:putative transcription factor [Erysiphe necator]|uniref:Putative transcription factor n=1 Tax=Uncinula necator TaxID=52586 RepID=A0A0B1PA35_UNCNE|nr:putative transcription factor [Erysiphe necator]